MLAAAIARVTKVSRQIIWLSRMPAPSNPAASIRRIMSRMSGMGDVPGTRMEMLMGSAMGVASLGSVYIQHGVPPAMLQASQSW